VVHLDAVPNFRDIGGHRTANSRRIRKGRVFRSGHLANATNADLQVLQQLGIGTVLDLRDPSDVSVQGEDRLPDGATLVQIPGAVDTNASIYALFDDGTPEEIEQTFPLGAARELMLTSAIDWSRDESRRERLAEIIRWVIKTDTPTLIHCAAGKDRTGFASAVIQWALGAPENVIVDDYLRSNEERREEIAAMLLTLQARGVAHDLLEPFMVQREEYMRSYLHAARELWGDVDGYLRMGLGLSDEEVAALRHYLLD